MKQASIPNERQKQKLTASQDTLHDVSLDEDHSLIQFDHPRNPEDIDDLRYRLVSSGLATTTTALATAKSGRHLLLEGAGTTANLNGEGFLPIEQPLLFTRSTRLPHRNWSASMAMSIRKIKSVPGHGGFQHEMKDSRLGTVSPPVVLGDRGKAQPLSDPLPRRVMKSLLVKGSAGMGLALLSMGALELAVAAAHSALGGTKRKTTNFGNEVDDIGREAVLKRQRNYSIRLESPGFAALPPLEDQSSHYQQQQRKRQKRQGGWPFPIEGLGRPQGLIHHADDNGGPRLGGTEQRSMGQLTQHPPTQPPSDSQSVTRSVSVAARAIVGVPVPTMWSAKSGDGVKCTEPPAQKTTAPQKYHDWTLLPSVRLDCKSASLSQPDQLARPKLFGNGDDLVQLRPCGLSWQAIPRDTKGDHKETGAQFGFSSRRIHAVFRDQKDERKQNSPKTSKASKASAFGEAKIGEKKSIETLSAVMSDCDLSLSLNDTLQRLDTQHLTGCDALLLEPTRIQCKTADESSPKMQQNVSRLCVRGLNWSREDTVMASSPIRSTSSWSISQLVLQAKEFSHLGARILSFLPTRERHKLRRVCRLWNSRLSFSATVVLDLSDQYTLTDVQFKAVIRNYTKLQYINLRGCRQITNEAISTLARDQKGTLKKLDISRLPKISDDGLQPLGKCKKLEMIYVARSNKITHQGVQYLSERCPNLIPPVLMPALTRQRGYYWMETSRRPIAALATPSLSPSLPVVPRMMRGRSKVVGLESAGPGNLPAWPPALSRNSSSSISVPAPGN